MIKVKSATFATSAPSINEVPFEGVSEVAFLGRSNVGKSSFINSLCERKSLAKSSSTPGKTQLINFFDVAFLSEDLEYRCRFVDLPGFGYAKVSKGIKENWHRNLTQYLQERISIRTFVHLVDARHPNMPLDLQTAQFLQQQKRKDQNIITIYTKADKLNQKDKSALKAINKDSVLVSNLKKSGLDTARQIIFDSLFKG
jgi:GTP-binding protein